MPSRFLTVKEVVAEAFSAVPGGGTAGEQLLARQWVYTAMREIGPSTDFIAVAEVPASNLSIRKPDDMSSAIDIALVDSAGNDIKYNYRPGNKRIKPYKGGSDGVISQLDGLGVEVSEDAYFFHLNSSELAQSVATAKIRYWKFPIDDSGLPMVPEKQKYATMCFIWYLLTKRKAQGRFDRAQAYQEWITERNRARSRSKMPSQMAYDAIAKSWASMINIPNFDNF